MKQTTLSLLLAVFLFWSCAENTGKSKMSASQIEEELSMLTTELKNMDYNIRQDTVLGNEMLTLTDSYYENFPDSANTPVILFRAGDIARGMGKFNRAVRYWETLWTNYPAHEKASDALFLQAFTYDGDLSDAASAEKYYNLYLEKYPDTEMATQVNLLISMLGKNEDQILEMLKVNQDTIR